MNELADKLKNEFKDKDYAHAYVNEFLNASIATQIKVLREQRDWTQQQLAALAEMQQARISVLENVNNDMWSISTLQRLAEAFDVTLKVSFESFSSRIQEIQNFSRDSLEKLSREADLARTDGQLAWDSNYIEPLLEYLVSQADASELLPPTRDSGTTNVKVEVKANDELALAA